jgi:hypothetical protein
MKKFLCLAAMAALLVSCGGKKQPHADSDTKPATISL